MSAEAVALCMGIRDSRHTLFISTGDQQSKNFKQSKPKKKKKRNRTAPQAQNLR
jgi:hypothetical protein